MKKNRLIGLIIIVELILLGGAVHLEVTIGACICAVLGCLAGPIGMWIGTVIGGIIQYLVS